MMENNKELIEEMEKLSQEYKFDFIRSFEDENKSDDGPIVKYSSVEQYYNTYKGTRSVSVGSCVSCQTKMM